MLFVIIYLFKVPSVNTRLAALALLAAAAGLDWLDGYLARRLGISSKIGSLLDTLGDRISENLLLVYFAWEKLVPLYVPLVFITRSFVSDLIRHINYSRGYATFGINKSFLGRALVASKASRALYLILKMSVFFAGGAALLAEVSGVAPALLGGLKVSLLWGSGLLVAFNVLRFIFLAADSRGVLKEEFLKNEQE
jgi:phosphatidylglycerophosphate synthase